MKKINRVLVKSIVAIVLPLMLFASIVGVAGNKAFSDAMQLQYASSAYRMADAAALEVDPDRMDAYLASGGESEEYRAVWDRLDQLCNALGVTFIYVIQPDLTDYGHITFVFSTVNADFNEYSPFEVGLVRETTNEQYRQQYRNLYEGKTEQELQFLESRQFSAATHHLTAMRALKGSDGETKAILCVQRQMSGLQLTSERFHRSVLHVLIAIVLMVILSQAVYLNWALITPVRRITDEAFRFAGENRPAKVKLVDQLHNRDEIGQLAASIDRMEEQVGEYIDNLTTITAEKQRITTELTLARRIQEAMLPHQFPPFPERKEFELYASMTPAKAVGGDFYDFFLIDEDHLGLVMADVSGKGIPAALFMMICKTILQSCAMLGQSPAEILTKTNEALCSNNQVDMFVTVWTGILESSPGRLRAANAGHEYPALKRAGGIFELYKRKHGLAVAAMGGVSYREYELQLSPGDALFVYTDGVPEAIDAREQAFGTERLLHALNLDPAAGPEELLRNVRREMDAFVKDAEQFDDITMLGFVYHGTEEQTMPKTITMEASLSNLERALAFVDETLEQMGCPMKQQMQVDLALEEAFVNVANYAYGGEPGPVSLSVLAEGETGQITIMLMDRGTPFDPLGREEPDLSLPAEEREIGGLGIFMVKKSMDEVRYAYEDGQNILTMVKHIRG